MPPASQISANDLLNYLREKFIRGLQYISEDPRQHDLMPEQDIRKIGFSYPTIREILAESIRNRLLPAETNIEITLIILHGTFSGIIKNWLMAPQRFDLYQQAPLLMSMLCAESSDGELAQRGQQSAAGSG